MMHNGPIRLILACTMVAFVAACAEDNPCPAGQSDVGSTNPNAPPGTVCCVNDSPVNGVHYYYQDHIGAICPVLIGTCTDTATHTCTGPTDQTD